MFKNASVSTKGFTAFAIMTLLAIGTSGIILTSARTASDLVKHNSEITKVINQTNDLGELVTTAELSMKSFLLTGNRDYVAQYEGLSGKIDQSFSKLEPLIQASSSDETSALKDAKSAIDNWRKSVIERQIKLMRDPMTVDLARAIELTSQGQSLLDHFSSKLHFIKNTLKTRAGSASANQRSALSFVETITLVSSVVVALFAALLGFLNFRLVSRPLAQLASVTSRLAEGDLDVVVDSSGNDEIGKMAKSIEVFREAAIANRRLEEEAEENRERAEADRIAAQERAEAEAADKLQVATSGLAAGLRRLASGDLSFQIDEAFAPDFETLRHDFNQSVQQLGSTLTSIANSINAIEGGTREIASGADDLARRTEQQAASLEETAAAVEEITSNVANSTKRTEEARGLAGQANTSAEKSADVVSHAEEAMRKIEASSEQISNIIGVIDEIAFQTNLLALNAGVEAARAGEAGKGFAVVAQEVRELAQRSAQAAKEIKELIQNSSSEVSNGVTLVRNTSEALTTIGKFIVEINQQVESIALSSREQSTGLAEVNQAVNAMDQSTQQNAAMVEESNAASSALAGEAAKLRELVMQFKLTGVEASHADFTEEAKPARRAAPAAASTAPLRAVHQNMAVAVAKDWEEF